MNDIVVITGFAVTALTLLSASVQDIRSREVSDIHWYVIGAAGIVSMILSTNGTVTAGRMMVCIGTLMILFDIFHDRGWTRRADVLFYSVIVLMFAVPLASSSDDVFIVSSMTVPVCCLIFVSLFFTGVIKGGADAKCLISLAVMFPSYPVTSFFPLISVPPSLITMFMPFPAAVLFCASLFSAAAMIPVIIRNILRGDTEMPNMFTGYMIDPSDVQRSHVWLMEGQEGKERVWVTPKIPFIVPLTAAAVFVACAGNIFFLI